MDRNFGIGHEVTMKGIEESSAVCSGLDLRPVGLEHRQISGRAETSLGTANDGRGILPILTLLHSATGNLVD